jgi:hypothetical protein
MRTPSVRGLIVTVGIVLALSGAPTALAQEDPSASAARTDPEKGTRDGSPLDDLPEHIRLLSERGLRPDWSPNGKQLVILEGAPLGDVAILDVRTGRTRTVTDQFEHRGFTRAYFLHNGDLLLCVRRQDRSLHQSVRRPGDSPA